MFASLLMDRHLLVFLRKLHPCSNANPENSTRILCRAYSADRIISLRRLRTVVEAGKLRFRKLLRDTHNLAVGLMFEIFEAFLVALMVAIAEHVCIERLCLQNRKQGWFCL